MKKILLIILILSSYNLNCAENNQNNSINTIGGLVLGGSALLGSGITLVWDSFFDSQIANTCTADHHTCSYLDRSKWIKLTVGLMFGVGGPLLLYKAKKLFLGTIINNQLHHRQNQRQPDSNA